MTRALLILAVLVSAAAAAGAKPVTLEAKDRPLSEVAAAVAKAADAHVDVARAIADVKVTVSFAGTPLAEALATLAARAGDDVEAVEEEGVWRLRRKAPDWREVVAKRLDTRVDLDFADAPLADALDFLARAAGLWIGLDPAVAKEKSGDELLVNLRVAEVTAKTALALLVAVHGLKSDVRWGGVWVSTPKAIDRLPKEPLPLPGPDVAESERRLRERLAAPATWSFPELPLDRAVAFVRRTTGLNLVFAPGVADAAKEVTAAEDVTDLPLALGLARLLYPRGFSFRIERDVVMIYST